MAAIEFDIYNVRYFVEGFVIGAFISYTLAILGFYERFAE